MVILYPLKIMVLDVYTFLVVNITSDSSFLKKKKDAHNIPNENCFPRNSDVFRVTEQKIYQYENSLSQ